MGTTDYYVAALKGSILRGNPNIQIVDISHGVKPFDIINASYYVQSASRDFPDGTIHIIGVDSEPIINMSSGALPAIMLLIFVQL